MVFDKDIPFELRISDPNGDNNEETSLELIRVKILLKVIL